jgi:hypothetical protein
MSKNSRNAAALNGFGSLQSDLQKRRSGLE